MIYILFGRLEQFGTFGLVWTVFSIILETHLEHFLCFPAILDDLDEKKSIKIARKID
jgi:ABC-type tungstate transport system substrate-binding protein